MSKFAPPSPSGVFQLPHPYPLFSRRKASLAQLFHSGPPTTPAFVTSMALIPYSCSHPCSPPVSLPMGALLILTRACSAGHLYTWTSFRFSICAEGPIPFYFLFPRTSRLGICAQPVFTHLAPIFPLRIKLATGRHFKRPFPGGAILPFPVFLPAHYPVFFSTLPWLFFLFRSRLIVSLRQETPPTEVFSCGRGFLRLLRDGWTAVFRLSISTFS